MISDLEGKGHNSSTICQAMGFGTSESIIRHYKRGVQPMYHRGEPLIAFWCQEMVKQLSEVPRIPVRKPYRVPSSVRAKQSKIEAAAASLQAFISTINHASALATDPPKRRGRPPKAAYENDSQVKRKPGRPKKQQVTA